MTTTINSYTKTITCLTHALSFIASRDKELESFSDFDCSYRLARQKVFEAITVAFKYIDKNDFEVAFDILSLSINHQMRFTPVYSFHVYTDADMNHDLRILRAFIKQLDLLHRTEVSMELTDERQKQLSATYEEISLCLSNVYSKGLVSTQEDCIRVLSLADDFILQMKPYRSPIVPTLY